MYAKPHLSYDDLLEKLTSRGLFVSDEGRALSLLRAAGYYHLSGYLYAFRQRDDDGAIVDPERYEENLTSDYLESLWRFDGRFRSVWLEGLLMVEMGLGAHLAHRLGAMDAFAHLDRSKLDVRECSRIPRREVESGKNRDQFTLWRSRYESLQRQASGEPYVKHVLDRYGPPLPIWVAVEFLDFGAATTLLQLSRYADRQAIGALMGFRVEKEFRSFMRQLNYFRNVCAHNSRLWNRVAVVKAQEPDPRYAPRELKHLLGARTDKVYLPLAVTAHAVRTLHPGSDWPSRMAAVLSTFPAVNHHDVHVDMGFTKDWHAERLWQ